MLTVNCGKCGLLIELPPKLPSEGILCPWCGVEHRFPVASVAADSLPSDNVPESGIVPATTIGQLKSAIQEEPPPTRQPVFRDERDTAPRDRVDQRHTSSGMLERIAVVL